MKDCVGLMKIPHNKISIWRKQQKQIKKTKNKQNIQWIANQKIKGKKKV